MKLLTSIKTSQFLTTALSPTVINTIGSTTVKVGGLTDAVIGLNSRGLVGLLTMIPKIIAGINKFGLSAIVASVRTVGLSNTLKSLNISPPMLAITAIVGAFVGLTAIIDACTTTTEEYEKKLEESSQKYSETCSKLESVNSELATTQQRIDELNAKESLTLVEQNELDNLKATNKQLEYRIDLLTKQAKLEAKDVSTDFADTVNSIKKDYSLAFAGALSQPDEAGSYGVDYNTLKSKYPINNNSTGSDYYFYTALYNNTNKNQEGYNFAYDKLQGLYSKVQDAVDNLGDIEYTALTEDAQKAYDYYFNLSNEFLLLPSEFGKAISESDIQTVFDSIFNYEKYEEANNALSELGKQGKLTAENISELYNSNDNVKQMIDYMAQLGLIDLSNPNIGFQQLANQLNQTANEAEKVEDVTKTFDELNEKIDKIQNAFSTATSAIQEYNEKGYLSIDNLQSLLALNDKYINALIDENGQLLTNADSYKKLIQAELEELEIQQVKSVLDNVLNLDKESAAKYAKINSINAENEAHKSLIQTLIREAFIKAKEKDLQENTTAYTDAVQASLPVIAKRIALIRTSKNALGESAKSGKEALEKEKKALEKSKKAWEDKLSKMQDAKSEIQDLIDLVTDMITKEKELEKDVLKKQKEDFDSLIDKRKELLDLEKEELDVQKELSDKQNTVAQNALAASIASLDDSSAGKKAQKEANDSLAESRSDLQSYLVDREYEIRSENLDKLKETTDEYYDSEIEKIDEYLDDERQLYNDACKAIDDDNGTLYARLRDYVYKYTTKSESELNHLWNTAKDALQKYGGENVTVAALMNNLDGQIYNVQNTVKGLETQIDNTADAIDKISDSLNNNLTNGITNAKVSLSEYKKALDELNQYSWYYKWQDKIYYSRMENRDSAIADILSQISGEYGGRTPASASSIYGQIKHYATGTKSAVGGLAEVGENGRELRVLNKGDGIIPNDITERLMALGTNPIEYLGNAFEKVFNQMISNNAIIPMLHNMPSISIPVKMQTADISPSININIQGDATQSTVNALKTEANKIIDQATKNVMNIALRNKRII